MQAAAPAVAAYPGEHAEQPPELDVPVEAKYMPATQLAQAVAPLALWYWPIEQLVHAMEPARENDPELQTAQLPVLV